MYRGLAWLAVCCTFVVVVVGAYVRLSDAGLGCPDWPGCYGELTPHHARDEISRAVEAQGGAHGPVSLDKAWKEMIHRYLAGILGLMILAIAILAWRRRAQSGRSPWLATAIVGVVAFQGTLGMWTVTMLLKPAIVTLHLLGGMTTFALLLWLALREHAPPAPAGAKDLRAWAAAGLGVLALQIALGGWVSANYAALACVDFPTCHGRWLPDMDFGNAFHVLRELGMNASGAPLTLEALNAIQWSHRAWALVAFLYLGGLAAWALRTAGLRALGAVLGALLLLQVALGAANVLLRVPLVLAAAHNAVAALLLAVVVVLNFVVFQRARKE